MRSGSPASPSKLEFLSFLLIPLSSIMFPHMSIMCLTARKVTAFKKTVVLYPLCIMILWLPCVFLGALGNGQPKVNAAMFADSPVAHEWLAERGKTENPFAKQLTGALKEAAGEAPLAGGAMVKAPSAQAAAFIKDLETGKLTHDELAPRLLGAVGSVKISDPPLYGAMVGLVGRIAKLESTDSILLQMLKLYVPAALAGILAAGIISAVMGSDCHQILALSTMFTRDIFEYYGGRRRFGERGAVFVGRAFILVANLVAYAIAWFKPPIFELAVRYAFSGFAAMSPVMIAALFWKRSTKWGALASTIFVAFCIAGMQFCEHHYKIPGKEVVILALPQLHTPLLYLNPAGFLFTWGFTPVVPMVLGSTLCIILVSLLTPGPSAATIDKYFGQSRDVPASAPLAAAV
jgi:Na+/proline symporter